MTRYIKLKLPTINHTETSNQQLLEDNKETLIRKKSNNKESSSEENQFAENELREHQRVVLK